MEAKKEDDRDEAELVKQVKPLIEQADKILNETAGSIKGADPDNRLSNKAKRHMQDHRATPEEQRLAEALKVVGYDCSSRYFIPLKVPLFESSWRKYKVRLNGRKISSTLSPRQRGTSDHFWMHLAVRLVLPSPLSISHLTATILLRAVDPNRKRRCATVGRCTQLTWQIGESTLASITSSSDV